MPAFHPCNRRNCICRFFRCSKRQKRLVLCANLFTWRWDLQGLVLYVLGNYTLNRFFAFVFVAFSSYADKNHIVSLDSLVETSLELIGKYYVKRL